MAGELFHMIDGDRLFALTTEAVYGGPIADGRPASVVEQRLREGADPASFIGNAAATGRSQIARKSVRQILWIEEAGFLVIKQHWLWDPIRFPFSDRARGRETFDRLCQTLAPGRSIVSSKISLHDLPVPPKTALGFLFAFLGFAAVVCGAVDTLPAEARVKGGAFAQILADFGAQIGPAAAFGVGAIGLLGGFGLLIAWWLKRPKKLMVRIHQGKLVSLDDSALN